MEEALGDHISFRRFVGLDLQEDAPDHSTSACSARHCRSAGRAVAVLRRTVKILK